MQDTTSLRHPLQLYRFLRECLVHQESVCLATVIARSGSGPREAGAAIVVTGEGKTLGTVGGGLLEAKALAMAQAAIRNRRPDCGTFLLTDKEASANGMICGGQVEILVDFVDGDNPAALQVMEALLEYGKKGQPCWLVRSIRQAEKTGTLETGLGLMDEAGLQLGFFVCSRPGCGGSPRPMPEKRTVACRIWRYPLFCPTDRCTRKRSSSSGPAMSDRSWQPSALLPDFARL